MKYIFEAEIYFDYPDELYGERRSRTYLVEAGSATTAAKLAAIVGRRNRNGGLVPRVTSLKEIGFLDAS
jgi:hypothetical protein